ncbi:MAG: NUDIX hydrolase [Candidatus Nanopelagicales bacterium]
MALEMPAALVARARTLAQGGDWTPPPCRDATTIVLLRDGAAGLQALLMRRPDTMAFAPGMHVFPGGSVDPVADSQPPVRGWMPDPGAGDPELARALVVAGVRETFEEAGVLLAVDHAGRPARPDDQWAADRQASERASGFPAVLARRRLHITGDLLVPIAHWITPEVETRRYDTRFLVAALPEGQSVAAHTTETDSGHWMAPGDALAAYRAGQMAMLPPTVAVLADLVGRRSVAAAMEWARSRRQTVVPVMPRPRVAGEHLEWVLVHGYTGAVISATDQPAGSEERGIG